jgi:hypothetical protein
LLYDYKDVVAGTALQLDVRSLSAGVYYVKMLGENRVATEKLIVE